MVINAYNIEMFKCNTTYLNICRPMHWSDVDKMSYYKHFQVNKLANLDHTTGSRITSAMYYTRHWPLKQTNDLLQRCLHSKHDFHIVLTVDISIEVDTSDNGSQYWPMFSKIGSLAEWTFSKSLIIQHIWTQLVNIALQTMFIDIRTVALFFLVLCGEK